jgi:thiol-disulfide isomerase/thioredoxin
VKKWLTNAVTLFLVAGVAILMSLEGLRGGNLLPDGSDAPAFDVEKYGGGRVTSAELKGQVVMLDFWATWCGPCREEMPWLVDVAKGYEAKGVRFVAANRDDDEPQAAIAAYLKREVAGLEPYVVYADAFMTGKYRVEAFPTLYVVGKDGKVLASAQGSVSEWRVRRWLNAALEK